MDQDALFQTLIATAVDGIMVIDEMGTVQVYNGACERLFLYSSDDVIGKNVSMLMPAPYRREHDGYLARYKKTGERRIIGIGREVAGRRKDGTTFPMYLSVGEGTYKGKRIFVGVIHDITAANRAEARIIELQSELVHVTRLTAMGQISSALAHELNQPLTATLNYLNAARRTTGSDLSAQAVKTGELLDKATRQIERAGHIIRRLRAFVEKRESARSVENVNTLAKDAIALGLVGTAHIGVTVSTKLEADLPRVLVDRVQIQQVLINLLRNAVEAMQESPTRTLDVATLVSEDKDIVVSVADSGPGVPPEIAEKMFQPFVTSKPGGMGVGLAISRSIVEAHGGRLWMTPNKNGGVAFCFTLPAQGTKGD
jgi:two-component system, LuxR family, sensor kinase FixL